MQNGHRGAPSRRGSLGKVAGIPRGHSRLSWLDLIFFFFLSQEREREILSQDRMCGMILVCRFFLSSCCGPPAIPDSSGKSASASLAMPAAVPSSQAACHSGTPPKSPPTHARFPQQQSEAFLARQRVPGSRQKATEELKQFKEKVNALFMHTLGGDLLLLWISMLKKDWLWLHATQFDKELSKSPLQSDPFKKGASGNASSSSSATTSSPPPSTATASDQSNAGGEGKGAVPEKPKFKLDLNAEAFIPQSRARFIVSFVCVDHWLHSLLPQAFTATHTLCTIGVPVPLAPFHRIVSPQHVLAVSSGQSSRNASFGPASGQVCSSLF